MCSGSLVKPLPLNGIAQDIVTKSSKFVEMDVTYTSSNTGLVFVAEYNYAKNGSAKYQFRSVAVPMVNGGRIANMSYEDLQKKYTLVDGNIK
jgi:hypothetical protein